jgi:hypothetical protein
MIAILQFDSVSMPVFNDLLARDHLPTLDKFRRKGTWLSLATPAEYFEGSGSYAIYTGTDVGAHGQAKRVQETSPYRGYCGDGLCSHWC